MLKNINSAEILGADMDDIRTEFRERNLMPLYNQLSNDIYKPFFPTEGIQKEFRDIEEKISIENPFEEARDILLDIQEDLRELSFDDDFNIDIENYLPSYDEMQQSALPETPGVNPQVVSTPMPAPGTVSQSGLTPTEQALLSSEEQQIRLRQRGMA